MRRVLSLKPEHTLTDTHTHTHTERERERQTDRQTDRDSVCMRRAIACPVVIFVTAVIAGGLQAHAGRKEGGRKDVLATMNGVIN